MEKTIFNSIRVRVIIYSSTLPAVSNDAKFYEDLISKALEEKYGKPKDFPEVVWMGIVDSTNLWVSEAPRGHLSERDVSFSCVLKWVSVDGGSVERECSFIENCGPQAASIVSNDEPRIVHEVFQIVLTSCLHRHPRLPATDQAILTKVTKRAVTRGV